MESCQVIWLSLARSRELEHRSERAARGHPARSAPWNWTSTRFMDTAVAALPALAIGNAL